VFLIEKALKATGRAFTWEVLRSGDAAIRFFEHADTDASKPCPDVVILDINLPREPGSVVLKKMRASVRCARARVIAVSTSDAPRDREQMTELGADSYFRKPSEFDEFMKLGDLVVRVLGGGAN